MPVFQTDRDEGVRNAMNEKSVKWIVVGVIALVVIFVFRDEIGKLIERAQEVSVSSEGVKLVATPIGQTKVTVESVSEKIYAGTPKVDDNVYVDRQHKFVISWPQNSGWIPHHKMTESDWARLGIVRDPSYQPAFAVYHWDTPESPHAGAVSIDVYSSDQYRHDIKTFLASIIDNARNHGIAVDEVTVDENTGGAVLVTLDKKSNLSAVNRLVVHDPFVYNIFSTSYPSTAEYAKLRDDTNMIVNSFKILD